MLSKTDKILLIQSRSFGDAIILTSLINSLRKNFSNLSINLLCRPQFELIYKNNPFINKIYYKELPFGTYKKNVFTSFIKLLIFLFRFRKEKFDFCINVYPDIREELITSFINSKRKISIKYSPKHPLYSSFRRPIFKNPFKNIITIPDEIINIYEIHKFIAYKLNCTSFEKSNIFLKSQIASSNTIGIHPFAGGQKCKNWNNEKWIELTKLITKELKFNTVIFCSKHEEAICNKIFRTIINDNVKIQCGDLLSFFEEMQKCKLIIGLDSFAIHAAHALNIKSIALLGPNDPKIWSPDTTLPINKPNNCTFYPCYNIPKCINKKFEFICMRCIEVKNVYPVIKNLL